jgi:hypothetical protein
MYKHIGATSAKKKNAQWVYSQISNDKKISFLSRIIPDFGKKWLKMTEFSSGFQKTATLHFFQNIDGVMGEMT